MKPALRWLGLLLCATLALQLFFVLRIGLTTVVDPQSTAFQRSEAWRIAGATGRLPWRQEWTPYGEISDHLKRAVIASEDTAFLQHRGVEWRAIETAWERNNRAAAQAARRQARRSDDAARPPRIFGGSTITQQLAKNLLLSGERTLLRKGQELALASTLELVLDKQRILELYLNSVEWGEGVFGAEAAARHYFRKPAAQLSAREAARLAVMLPRPRYFEQAPNSSYLAARTSAIAARMAGTPLP